MELTRSPVWRGPLVLTAAAIAAGTLAIAPATVGGSTDRKFHLGVVC